VEIRVRETERPRHGNSWLAFEGDAVAKNENANPVCWLAWDAGEEGVNRNRQLSIHEKCTESGSGYAITTTVTTTPRRLALDP
jgi:hypothetical protein